MAVTAVAVRKTSTDRYGDVLINRHARRDDNVKVPQDQAGSVMYYEPSFEQFRVGFATTAAGSRAPQFARWSPLGTLVQANSANSMNQYISINSPAAAVASCCAWTSNLTGLGS